MHVKKWMLEPIGKIKARFLPTHAGPQCGIRCEQQTGSPRAFACLRKLVELISLAR